MRLKRQVCTLTQQIETYRGLLKKGRSLEISYEILVANQAAETHRILVFLNIKPPEPLVVEVGPTVPVSLETMVENYQEVKQALTNTVFEKFLN